MALDVQVKHIKMMRAVNPSLRKLPEESFTEWQDKARAKLKELLGLPMETVTDPNFRIEWTHDEGTYTETRFCFESEPEATVVCHLLLPKEMSAEKIPMVINLQGHSRGFHISLGHPKYPGDEEDIHGGDRDFAQQIVARGQAALAIEQRAFGERGGNPEPQCYQSGVQELMLGRTLIGERCWDISRSIDIIEEHFPMIDMEKIAVMGNSGGGTSTIYAAAVDTRIAAAMPSCALCGYSASIGEQHHCLCNYVPNVMKYFDMGDIVGLVAPRVFIAVNGKDDGSFPLDSAKKQIEIASKVYKEVGAEDKLYHITGPEGHRFYAALAWPVFDELTGWK